MNSVRKAARTKYDVRGNPNRYPSHVAAISRCTPKIISSEAKRREMSKLTQITDESNTQPTADEAHRLPQLPHEPLRCSSLPAKSIGRDFLTLGLFVAEKRGSDQTQKKPASPSCCYTPDPLLLHRINQYMLDPEYPSAPPSAILRSTKIRFWIHFVATRVRLIVSSYAD